MLRSFLRVIPAFLEMLSNLKIIDQKSIDLATDIIFRQKINKKIDQ